MDKVAHAVGLAPEEFRRRNFIHEGETTATSQLIRERVDMGPPAHARVTAQRLPRETRTIRS
jgi:CO/xanthine dehydrogenase Mo-binding subunit